MGNYYICEEMQKLRDGLDARGIPWIDHSETGDSGSGYWMCRTRFEYNDTIWSVIHGYGSYGGYDVFCKKDSELLECMCDLVNDGEPEGHLTADDVFKLMEESNDKDN